MPERQKAQVCSSFIAFLIWISGVSIRTMAGEGMPEPADDGWKKLVGAVDELNRTEFHESDPKVNDEMKAKCFRKAGELADQFRDYLQRSTNRAHLDEAWEKRMEMLEVAAFGIPARKDELEKAEQQGLSDTNLSAKGREVILRNRIERIGDLREREQAVRRLKDEAESPTGFFCWHMLDIAEISPYPHSREIVDEILNLKAGVEPLEWYRAHTPAKFGTVDNYISSEKSVQQYYREEALRLEQKLNRIGHPVELKFTALGGAKVDLADYRGKVVLLDFWATWCPACVAGLPRIKSARRVFQKQGFEVIGLSYDDKRGDLERFLKRQEMPWPQFFSTEGLNASLIQAFGGPSPPDYWLIDQRGCLVDVVADQDLDGKIKRLLAGSNGTASEKPLDK